MARMVTLIFLAVLLALLAHAVPRDPSASAMLNRSQASDQNPSRLQRVIAKAKRGEHVTIGFIGGSITYGQQASRTDRQYANLVAAWWGDRFPQSKITIVNAGVPGTGSTYGCLRVTRDLLSYHPDFVVVEFGVNDRDDLDHAKTYEGVVRQLLLDAGNPAVLLLFLMHHDGTNAQALQSQIGRGYQLPMVSFRDAVWPLITEGRMQVSDVLADTVHPNDRGHAQIASLITNLLDRTLHRKLVAFNPRLPPPVFSDLFSSSKIVEANAMQVMSNDGWTRDPITGCWCSIKPFSTIEFSVNGRWIDLIYARKTTMGGTVEVMVDNQPPVRCDSWFDGTWEGYYQTDAVGKNLSPGIHKVRITLIAEHNAQSTAHRFQIAGLGLIGAQ